MFSIQHLNTDIQHARRISDNIILCSDINAKHEAWLSNTSDNVGEDVWSWIQNTHLVIANDKPYDITYRGVHGESAIDITAYTPNLFTQLITWYADSQRHDVSSDHVPICMELHDDTYVTCVKKIQLRS